MKQFEALLFPESDRLTPAVGLEMKGKKMVIETIFGKRQTVHPDKVVFRRAIAAESKTEALEAVRADVATAEALADEVDVELLWESVVDESDGPRGIAELATSWFARSPGLPELKAIELALGRDDEFFQRVAGRFRPVTRAKRAEALERRAAEARAREQFEATIERLRGYRETGLPDGFANGATDGDEDVREALERVAHFVQHGSGPGEDVVEALGLDGGKREAALALLVELAFVERPTDLVVARHRLTRTFKPAHRAAVDDVRAACEARDDLPEAAVKAFTIDDADTRDFDDALSVSDVDGRLRLGVHIADPSSYIARESVLDAEAYGRGTTVYLPDRKLPMFPEELSEDVLSLVAGSPRPVVSFYFPLPFSGEPPTPHIVKERLTVRANLTYQAVDDALSNERALPDSAHDALAILADATEALARWRRDAGAVVIHSPDIKVTVSDDGDVDVVRSDSDTPAHRIVSESMILVNFAGARYLSERGIAAIFRAQNPPSEPVRVEGPYDPNVFRREVRKLERAKLSLEPAAHAGLGLPLYTQLSSPLRRYGDLVMHRQLSHAIAGEPVPYEDRDALLEVVVTSDMNYQTAVSAERRAKQAWTLRYYEARIGEGVEGIVVDPPKGRRGTFVELTATCFVARLEPNAAESVAVGDVLRVRIRAVEILEEDVVVESGA